jgi:putative transposase
VDALKKEGLSLRKACRLTGISLPGYQYQPQESELNMKILENMRTISGTYKSWGLPTIFHYLRRLGYLVNRKRVHRLYKLAGLQIRRRRRREKRIQERFLQCPPIRPNQRWSLDFIHDSTAGHRKLKCLVVVDDYTREALAIHVARSIPSRMVCQVLDRLIVIYGKPEIILTDNGPEFVAGAYALWALASKIRIEYIEPGKPNQNAFAEAFNSILREQCLNQNWFLSLEDAERIIEEWRRDYNQVRPHGSLGGQTPEEFRKNYSGKTLNQIELQKGV